VKRLLLTGAAGFLGRHCLPLLTDQYEVHCTTTGRGPASQGRSVWHKVDLLQSEQVVALVSDVRPSHLLHLAWITEPNTYWISEANLIWLQRSIDLIRAFRSNGGLRAVIAGTCAEYEWIQNPLSEYSTPIRPSTLYGATKAALGLVFEAFCRQQGLSGAWGRVFFLYGPGEHPSRLVPSVAQALLGSKHAPCTVGKQKRDFLYVQDAARAFAMLLASDVTGSVNIASGVGLPVRDLVGALAAQLGRPDLVQFGALPDRDEPSMIVADTSRLRGELGWHPEFTLENGIQESVEWWRRQRGSE
jgi:nucleoside-diphosphate-sugar epimerase